MRPGSRPYLASMLALIVVTTAISADALAVALGLVIGPTGVVITLIRIRETRPSRPMIWYGMCLVGLLFLGAGAAHVFVGDAAYPALPDYIDLAAYALAVLTFAVLVVHRTRLAGRSSVTEILILPGGLAVILWNFVLAPTMQNDVFNVEARILNGAFNTLSLVLCGLFAALLFGPGFRNRSLHLLSLMALGALAGDVLAATQTAGASFIGLDRLVVLSPALAFLAATMATLDHSMGRVTESTIEPEGSFGSFRLTTMATSAMIAPVVLATRLGQNDPAWVVVGTLMIWIVTMAGVLGRLGGLIQARERQADSNRILTTAAEQFMAATAPTTMYTAAIRAASAMVDEAEHLRTAVLVHNDDRWEIAAATGDETGDDVGSAVEFFPLHDGVLDALAERRVEQFIHIPALDHVGSVAPAMCLFPLVAAGNLRGALLVTSDLPLDQFTANAVASLSTDLSLALEGAARAQALHREASERRFRALVDKSNDVIALLDDDSTIDFIGPAVSRLLGHEEKALLGLSMLDLVHVDDRARFRACVNRHPSAPFSAEVRLVDNDGRPRWFDIIAADHRHDPNIERIVVTARDVHGRKVAEDKRQESEARFRSLVQHANDLVAVLNTEGNLTYISPSVERILGYTAAEMEGAHFASIVAHRHQGQLGDALAQLTLRSETPHRFELDLTTSGGETRTLDITARDLRHEPSVEGIVVNARDITNRKRLEQSLRHQALHDSLTGIPNRTLFHDRVEQALSQRGCDIAVMVIDIDDFKTVNDGLGHHAGDDLLKIIAFRLRQVLRVGDTAARLGGDEFAVLIEDADDRTKVGEIAERLLRKIREPFEVGGRDLTVEGSIGIAFSGDVDHRSAEILIRGADAAMYAAKASGKGRWESYEESMYLGAMARLHLKTGLAQALGRDEFELWYQPVVNIGDGSLVGFEALLRWDRPGLGLVNPAEFIPIAEETGLIVPIGRWVMREAIAQLAIWQDTLGMPDLHMGVNVSPRQLDDDQLIPAITSAIADNGVRPEQVSIELTETSLVAENSPQSDRIDAIRDIGCEVLADDFGAGYASYAALRRLPFTGVKLDRSLIDGVAGDDESSARAQVRSMIEMAHHLGLKVVAEGIETAEQVHVLQELGCVLGQGYHFGRPAINGGVTVSETV